MIFTEGKIKIEISKKTDGVNIEVVQSTGEILHSVSITTATIISAILKYIAERRQ